MSLVALCLVIVSAFMHATWNFFAKQSGGGLAFVWSYMTVSVVIYSPVAIGLSFIHSVTIGWSEITVILTSAIIHLVYALTLQRGYRVGDLSFIYPIARGSGPMLVAILAMFIYQEQLSFFGWIGIICIVVSVFLLTGGLQSIKQLKSQKQLLLGLMIGILIASYTLVDKAAVSVVQMTPLLFYYGTIIGQLVLLAPFIWSKQSAVKKEWQNNRKAMIWVGILNPLAYILVLTAMVYTPVSYVAPVREISILIGTLLGTRILSEGMEVRRVIAAGVMITGVVIVAVS